jgi:hypothetical protein
MVKQPEKYRWNSIGYHLQTNTGVIFYRPTLVSKSSPLIGVGLRNARE